MSSVVRAFRHLQLCCVLPAPAATVLVLTDCPVCLPNVNDLWGAVDMPVTLDSASVNVQIISSLSNLIEVLRLTRVNLVLLPKFPQKWPQDFMEEYWAG